MPTKKDSAPLGTPSACSGLVPVATTSHSPLATSHLAPAPGTDRAGRIGYYHQLSREAGRVSIMAAVAAGIELHRAKLELEHGNFGLWIKRNCEFGQRTAQNYMNLAESVVCGDGLAELLEDPEPPRVEVLEEHVRPIEARTLTQLYFDLGICKPGKVGGARPGAGRPPKGEPNANTELHEALLLANRMVGDLATWAIADDGWGVLPDDVLQQCLATLGDVTKRGRDVLSGRRQASKARGKA